MNRHLAGPVRDRAVDDALTAPPIDHPPLRYGGREYREPKEFVWGTHRAMAPELTLARIRPHLHKAGITRVADVTGLDTAGIPVVVAVRPPSQTLSVEGGKGASLAAAAASATMEALERYVGEADDVIDCWGTVEEVGHRLAAPVDRFPRWRAATVAPDRRYPWSEMRDLRTDEPYLVPAALVRLHMPEGIGVHTPWATTSNGLASGNHLPEAICAGLYEVIERDAVSCWKVAEAKGAPRLVVDPATITAPVIRGIIDQLAGAGIHTAIDWCPNDVGVPTCVAAIVDEQPHMGAYAGYGCHLDPEIAMIRAVTEAVQARTIFIAGARDDLLQGGYDVLKRGDVGARETLLHGVSVSVADIPNRATDSFHGDISVLLERLGSAGFERVVARELDASAFEIAVARVIVPGLEPYRFQWVGWGDRAQHFDPTPWTEGRRPLD